MNGKFFKIKEAGQGIEMIPEASLKPHVMGQHSVLQLIQNSIFLINSKRNKLFPAKDQTDYSDGRIDDHFMIVNLVMTVLHQKLRSRQKHPVSYIFFFFRQHNLFHQVICHGQLSLKIGFIQGLRAGTPRSVIWDISMYLIIGVIFGISQKNLSTFLRILFFSGSGINQSHFMGSACISSVYHPPPGAVIWLPAIVLTAFRTAMPPFLFPVKFQLYGTFWTIIIMGPIGDSGCGYTHGPFHDFPHTFFQARHHFRLAFCPSSQIFSLFLSKLDHPIPP